MGCALVGLHDHYWPGGRGGEVAPDLRVGTSDPSPKLYRRPTGVAPPAAVADVGGASAVAPPLPLLDRRCVLVTTDWCSDVGDDGRPLPPLLRGLSG